MYRLISPFFVCGVVMNNGRAVRCAPIVHYMWHWTGLQIISYAEKRGWKWELI